MIIVSLFFEAYLLKSRNATTRELMNMLENDLQVLMIS